MAITTKTRKGTYMGARAETWEVREGGPASKRDVFIRWIDQAHDKNGGYPAGALTVATVKGNFLKGTGVTLAARHPVTLPTA